MFRDASNGFLSNNRNSVLGCPAKCMEVQNPPCHFQREKWRDVVCKEIEQLEKVIENTERQLGDEKFLGKAPAKIVDGMKVKLGEYKVQLEKNREALGGL